MLAWIIDWVELRVHIVASQGVLVQLGLLEVKWMFTSNIWVLSWLSMDDSAIHLRETSEWAFQVLEYVLGCVAILLLVSSRRQRRVIWACFADCVLQDAFHHLMVFIEWLSKFGGSPSLWRVKLVWLHSYALVALRSNVYIDYLLCHLRGIYICYRRLRGQWFLSIRYFSLFYVS